MHVDEDRDKMQTSSPARILKLCMKQPKLLYISDNNNKGADQTARMRRLSSAFVVHTQQSQVMCFKLQEKRIRP